MRRLLLLTIIFLICLTGLSCQTIAPKSFLFDNSCEPPCWNSIEVGKTTKQEMQAILTSLPTVKKQTIDLIDIPWIFFDSEIRFNVQKGLIPFNYFAQADALIKDNTLVSIDFCGILKTSLKQAIDKTGEPKYVINAPAAASNGSIIILINPEKGIGYRYNTNNISENVRYRISPEYPLECIEFFSPDLFDNMLKEGLFSNGYDVSNPAEVLHPWTGYGNIEEKYPKWHP